MDTRRAALEVALKAGKEAKQNAGKRHHLRSMLEAEYPASQHPQAHELFEQACNGTEPATVLIRRSPSENRQFLFALIVTLVWIAGWLITKLLWSPGQYFNILFIGLGCGGGIAMFHGIQNESLEKYFR